jgi:hypothetical protein
MAAKRIIKETQMLRKISITIAASAVSLLLSGGMASAEECAYPGDTECGAPFASVMPLSSGQAAPEGYADTESGDPFLNMAPLYPEQMAPVGATGTEEPSVLCPSIPEQDCRD